jgi:hypothetical protein
VCVSSSYEMKSVVGDFVKAVMNLRVVWITGEFLDLLCVRGWLFVGSR